MAIVLRSPRMWWWLLASAYILASVVAGVLLALDKRAARLQRRRIPEATLHAIELLGGWPGSLIVRRLARHKTRKITYRAVFWLIVALHAAAWIGWAVWRLRQP